jgi:dihydroorotase-like cyclic amidohydrolase
MADLVIKNGLVVTPTGIITGGLAATGGKISHIGNNKSLPEATTTVDARGNFILPGVIDPHTHLHSTTDESLPFYEAIETESMSAAVNGTTTVVSTPFVPNKTPRQLAHLRELREAGSKNSFVDFKFNTVIFFDSHLDEMSEMVNEGFNTFKFLMGYSGEEAAAIGLVPVNWALFYKAAELIARIGPPAIQMVHCEEPEICHMLGERLKKMGRTDLASWEESRPAFVEGVHTFTAGLIANHLGSPLYIVHVNSSESVAAIRYLRAKGLRVWAETCSHYLTLTKYSSHGSMAKCAPPLRDEATQRMLWQALSGGTLQIVGTDQCMIARASKAKGMWDAAPGAGSIGSLLPVMMTDGVNKGRITIEQFVKLCSENAARALGIYPQKGVLNPGSDADIIIIDPEREWEMTMAAMKSALEYFCFEGYKAKGKVVKTFVRGELVAEDGEMVAKEPHGKYV